MKNLYSQLLDHLKADTRVAFATVTEASGSTPQKPGSSAVFGRKGLLAGTVGGGEFEAKVQSIAVDSIHSNLSGYYSFSLDEGQENNGAICGGQISVLVDARPGIHTPVFGKMAEDFQKRIPGVLLTQLGRDQGKEKITRTWMTASSSPDDLKDMDGLTIDAVKSFLLSEDTGTFRGPVVPVHGKKSDTRIFLEKILPFPHLVIAGAGHVGKALAHLGKLLDFDVTVIDDRPEYANAENIPDAGHFVVGDIGQAMKNLTIGRDIFIIIVTRGHRHDNEALLPCIGCDAAYVGMIGSKSKVEKMRRQFVGEGWATPEQWKKIHTPIGLEIHSKTVQEIAVSIAAQLVLVRNSKASLHG